MKVLVVEDEPTSLKLAHLVLATDGYSVRDADRPEKALEIIRREKPEVLLLDLALPGIDGLELARILKQDPATREVLIVAITGYPEQFSQQAALEAGCDAYIVKPINTRTLSRQVADVVAASASAEAKPEN